MRSILLTIVLSIFSFASFAEDYTPIPKIKSEEVTFISEDLPTNRLILTVEKGDTLSSMLEQAGVKKIDAAYALAELGNKFSPSNLKIGQKVAVNFLFTEDENIIDLIGLEVNIGGGKKVEVRRMVENIYMTHEFDIPLEIRTLKASGKIETSLYGSAQKAGLPAQAIMQLIRYYSYDVDFQREIKSGDSFSVLFEEKYDEHGDYVGVGDIIFATLVLKDKPHTIYRFITQNGQADYYNEEGHSIKKAFLRTPVDGARISSRYGKRKHPVLGYTKMHKGIDFAAPRGTPIYAAGNGIIKEMKRKGSFGNYVRISHGNGYDTAYAHAKRFAKGLRAGKRVKQGQVIAYVGTTGRSTGPHLHYELLKNGRHKNPLSIKSTPGKKLKNLPAGIFQSYRKRVDTLVASLPEKRKLAELAE